MERLRALIVDDERLARVGIRRELEEIGGVEVVGECVDGPEAVRAIRSTAPDVVFLDVRMPGMDGFEVVRRVGVEKMPAVIFVTAHDEHALRAFEVDAVDYVLKPIEPERFAESVRRVAGRLQTREAGESGREPPAGREGESGKDRAAARLDRLLDRLEALQDGGGEGEAGASGPRDTGPRDRLVVERAGRISLVPVAEIRWIEAAGNYARVHVGPETHLIRRTLKSLEKDLDPDTFLRVRRSAIVNMERVDHLEAADDGRYRIELEDGTELRASRRRAPAVREFLRRYR